MTAQIVAIGLLVVIFAVAIARKVNIGLIAFVGACAVGLWLASMPLDDIVDSFPVSIMILLVGVTFFSGIAQVNGTLDRLVTRGIARVGDKPRVIPVAFFALTGGMASMGTSLAGLVMFPIGMAVGKRYQIDPVLMGLSMGLGGLAAAFAPTSLFGIITYGTATEAGIALNPLLLFGIALVANLALLVVAMLAFGDLRSLLRPRRRAATRAVGIPSRPARTGGVVPAFAGQLQAESAGPGTGRGPGAVVAEPADETGPDSTHQPLTAIQKLTAASIVLLIVAVAVLTIAGIAPNVGVLCLVLGTGLVLLRPEHGVPALGKIDWSTVLLVGGVVTYVEVLESMGAVEMLGRGASSVGAPILTALLLCMIGGLVSAFVSTTGILAAVVPLAIPLVASGEVSAWALIVALAISSSLVDVSPFSTYGATLVATAPEEARGRVQSVLLRWGLSMVVIGPLLTVGLLVLPGFVFS